MVSESPNRTPAVAPDAVIEPGDLVDYATTANKEHELVRQSGESMVDHAVRAGGALLAAKALVDHGNWLPWLEANFNGSDRTANVYMQISANPQRAADLQEPSLRKALEVVSVPPPTVHVSQNTGENEWYTPPEIIDAAVEVMGGIDLDPASTVKANRIVHAESFYTKADDGLSQTWSGRVWMNPPYEQPWIERFCTKLVDEYNQDNIVEACVLVNNATETNWSQTLAKASNALCQPKGRVRFWHPDRTSAPLQGQEVHYFGEHDTRFRSVFEQFGVTYAR